MKTETLPFDAADLLTDDDSQIELLREALSSGHASFIANAIGTIARTRNVAELARTTGLTRAGLYKALNIEGAPRLPTLLGVLQALGFRLSIENAGPERPAAWSLVGDVDQETGFSIDFPGLCPYSALASPARPRAALLALAGGGRKSGLEPKQEAGRAELPA